MPGARDALRFVRFLGPKAECECEFNVNDIVYIWMYMVQLSHDFQETETLAFLLSLPLQKAGVSYRHSFLCIKLMAFTWGAVSVHSQSHAGV